jgi:Family of unknown function (DUF6355)
MAFTTTSPPPVSDGVTGEHGRCPTGKRVRLTSRPIAAAGIAVMSGVLMFVAPAAALAQPSVEAARAVAVTPQGAAECGYMHNWGETRQYDHCGRGDVEIKVNHMFGHDTFFCAHPGVQLIPQGDNSWVIMGAEWDGVRCP